jgi:hypothetical protein
MCCTFHCIKKIKNLNILLAQVLLPDFVFMNTYSKVLKVILNEQTKHVDQANRTFEKHITQILFAMSFHLKVKRLRVLSALFLNS